MTSYLIQSSICLAGFYSFYWVFLHREKLLSINRFYLLATSILSLTIPLLDFKFKSSAAVPIGNITPGISPVTETFFGWESIPFEAIYLIGLVVSVIIFGIRLYKAHKQLGNQFSFSRKQAVIIEVPGNEAYSFINTICIGEDLAQNAELRTQILAHEMAHVKGLHFLDLMFFELVKCALWFNPFTYFYSKSIKLQHEYIADHSALTHTSAQAYEQSLLRFTLSKIDNGLIAAFGQHPIQQRLNMIYKLNSNIMNKLKPLLSLPVLAILFVSFACSEEITSESDMAPEEVITEIPTDASVIIAVAETPVFDAHFVYDEVATNTGTIHELEVTSSFNSGISTAKFQDHEITEVIDIHPANISAEEKSSATLIFEEKESGNKN